MNEPIRNAWPGKFRALVINDRDPLFKGRVKVRIPDLMVSDKEHVGEWGKNGLWASPANNLLGGRSIQDTKIRFKGEDAYYQGTCYIPPKGSHVWVWFEKNDPSHPLYDFAAEYGDCQTLPENQLGKQYQKKWTLIKTKEGRAIVASDDPDDCRMEITGKKRKIKDPPFGDIDSVYTIPENQTTFLIDEREQHEKVLLADYRGNFIKLIQNENNLTDELHVNIGSNTHFYCGGNFYLTVGGELHINVTGDIYMSTANNIYTCANALHKEMALAFDRSSTTYDKTQSTLIDLASSTDITLQAANKIFNTCVYHIINAVTISHVGAMSSMILAGGNLCLMAGGAVIPYGKGGVSIQSDPVGAALSGEVSYPSQPGLAKPAVPDGQRYQDIILSEGAPVLTTPTGKTAMKNVDVKHDSVQTEQKASTEAGNTNKDSGNSDGSSDSSGSQSGSGSSNGNNSGSSSGGNSSEGSNSGSSSSSNSNGSSGSQQDDEDKPGFTDWLKSLFTFKRSYSVDSVYEETKSDYYYYSATTVRASVLELYSELSAYISNVSNSEVLGFTYDTLYDIDTRWDTVWNSGSLYYDEDWMSNLETCSNNLMSALVTTNYSYNNYSNDYIESVCNDLNSQYQYFKNDFCQELTNYSINLPERLTEYREIINDQIFICLQDVIDARTKGLRLTETLHTSIGELSLSICNALISIMLGECDKKLDDSITKINNIVSEDINKSGKEFIDEVRDTVNKSLNEKRDSLSEEIDSKSEISYRPQLISEKNVARLLSECKDSVVEIMETLKDPSAMVDDPDLANTLINTKIDQFLRSLNGKILSEDETDLALSQFRDNISGSVKQSLPYVFKDVNIESSVFNPVLDKLKNEFESSTYDYVTDYNNYKQSISETYGNALKDYLIENCSDKIEEIDRILDSVEPDIKKSDLLKTGVTELFNQIQDLVADTNCSDALRYCNPEIHSQVNEFKNKLDQDSVFNNAQKISESVDESINSIVNGIESGKQNSITDTFKLVTLKEGEFTKLYKKQHTCPKYVGCGYDDILFLNDKYRKTILPLIMNSGGSVVAFTLIKNTINTERSQLIDNECIQQYNEMFNNLESIDISNKWWNNLREILEQCSILNITPVITIMDFNDESNPFIVNQNESIRYTDKGWSNDIQGKFLKTLFTVVSEFDVKPIYNIGFGNFNNPKDPTNTKYSMYPTCGYMRQLINWCIYECGISSNYLCITKNKNGNLYYYNPYSEWHSYDDYTNNIKLEEHDILIRDKIDGEINDNASIVSYDSDDTISGGYAGFIVNSSPYSVIIFSMTNLMEKINTQRLNISDPNIMNDVFCKKSREAIRYFKTNDYFDRDGRIQFDANGEVS